MSNAKGVADLESAFEIFRKALLRTQQSEVSRLHQRHRADLDAIERAYKAAQAGVSTSSKSGGAEAVSMFEVDAPKKTNSFTIVGAVKQTVAKMPQEFNSQELIKQILIDFPEAHGVSKRLETRVSGNLMLLKDRGNLEQIAKGQRGIPARWRKK